MCERQHINIFNKDEVIGTVGLTIHNKEEGELRRMNVSEKYRRTGIATMLIQKLESYSKDIGIKRISLSTSNIFTPAVNLYKKNGYPF